MRTVKQSSQNMKTKKFQHLIAGMILYGYFSIRYYISISKFLIRKYIRKNVMGLHLLFENITMVVLILSFTSRGFNIMGCSKVDNEITDRYTSIVILMLAY